VAILLVRSDVFTVDTSLLYSACHFSFLMNPLRKLCNLGCTTWIIPTL